MCGASPTPGGSRSPGGSGLRRRHDHPAGSPASSRTCSKDRTRSCLRALRRHRRGLHGHRDPCSVASSVLGGEEWAGRLVFYVNLPIGILLLVLARKWCRCAVEGRRHPSIRSGTALRRRQPCWCSSVVEGKQGQPSHSGRGGCSGSLQGWFVASTSGSGSGPMGQGDIGRPVTDQSAVVRLGLAWARSTSPASPRSSSFSRSTCRTGWATAPCRQD